jgi:putative PIN family toxin of toxin-antitoxin system
VLKVTADSNIYISALNFGGLPDQLLDLARDGAIELAISSAIADEVAHVLRDKFAWAQNAIESARMQIAEFTEQVNPAFRIEVVAEDPTDNRILECAVAAGSDYLITGDKHLLRLGRYDAVKILKPAEFLEICAQAKNSL